MSRENYLKFKEFYRATIEGASDCDMEMFFAMLEVLARKLRELAKEGDIKA